LHNFEEVIGEETTFDLSLLSFLPKSNYTRNLKSQCLVSLIHTLSHSRANHLSPLIQPRTTRSQTWRSF